MKSRVPVTAAAALAWWVGLATAHAQQPVTPPEGVRVAMLEACQAAVAEDVASDARSSGFRGFDAEARLADQVAFTQKKNTLTMTGPGEFRYGVDYLWQPMTFSCEWDTSKERFKKGGYKRDRRADIAALPPEKARAVSECKREIRRQVEDEARRRDYYSPTIDIEPGVAFEETSDGLRLTGVLDYKLHHVQESASEFDYMCEWNVASGRLRRADLRPKGFWRVERGRVTCESRKQRRETCPAPIGGRVRVYSQHSDARCELGRNWSYTSREIAVWDGCRATFEFDMR
jgi:hypothetical protein